MLEIGVVKYDDEEKQRFDWWVNWKVLEIGGGKYDDEEKQRFDWWPSWKVLEIGGVKNGYHELTG